PAKERKKLFTVLIPVSDPASGSSLLRLASMLAAPADRQLLALHLSPPVDREAYRAGLDVEQTAEALQPLLAQAKNEKIDVEPVSFVSRDVPDDIASVARSRQADLVLMGFHRPVFGRSVLGGTVYRVLDATPADVGIFVNRGMGSAKRILVPYLGGAHDRFALELAQRVAKNTAASITVLHVVPPR